MRSELTIHKESYHGNVQVKWVAYRAFHHGFVSTDRGTKTILHHIKGATEPHLTHLSQLTLEFRVFL
jgi:hypothetical protein